MITCGRVAIAVFALAAAATEAGAALDEHTLEAMGGTYAADCARTDGPRVVVDKDAITVLDGAKRKVAKNIETAASWYGDGGNANEQYAGAYNRSGHVHLLPLGVVLRRLIWVVVHSRHSTSARKTPAIADGVVS